nr:hypothetical protein Iba_chr02bCG5720 [Ipomoea batatas]
MRGNGGSNSGNLGGVGATAATPATWARLEGDSGKLRQAWSATCNSVGRQGLSQLMKVGGPITGAHHSFDHVFLTYNLSQESTEAIGAVTTLSEEHYPPPNEKHRDVKNLIQLALFEASVGHLIPPAPESYETDLETTTEE